MIEQSMRISKPLVMKLEPEWFRNGYYVYVVVLKYKSKNYFYIGMTGDRKHIVARSPFYRMSGHFMLGKSTQNQIIKGLEKKLGIIVKDDSNILCEMDTTYYAWLINDYDKSQTALHRNNRIIGEKIESGLIAACWKQFGRDYVFNEKLSIKDFVAYEDAVTEILTQLNEIISANLSKIKINE